MSLTPSVHSIQAQILMNLLFKPEARFEELNVGKISTDHFTFHLKRLLELKLIKKRKNGAYTLTNKGKEFANRFDAQKAKFEKQAKIGVVVCGVRSQGGVKQYLVHQRLKQPYYGCYGFVTGKIRIGESVLETAAREFKEETGLTANFSLAGIEHKTDYSEKGKLLEDKFFFIVRAEKTKGRLIKKISEGRNLWFSKKEIKKLDKVFRDVMEIIEALGQKQVTFWENRFVVNEY